MCVLCGCVCCIYVSSFVFSHGLSPTALSSVMFVNVCFFKMAATISSKYEYKINGAVVMHNNGMKFNHFG